MIKSEEFGDSNCCTSITTHQGLHQLNANHSSLYRNLSSNILTSTNFQPVMYGGNDGPSASSHSIMRMNQGSPELVDEKPPTSSVNYLERARKCFSSSMMSHVETMNQYSLTSLNSMSTPPTSSSPITYGVILHNGPTHASHTQTTCTSTRPSNDSPSNQNSDQHYPTTNNPNSKIVNLLPTTMLSQPLNHHYTSTIKFCSSKSNSSEYDHHNQQNDNLSNNQSTERDHHMNNSNTSELLSHSLLRSTAEGGVIASTHLPSSTNTLTYATSSSPTRLLTNNQSDNKATTVMQQHPAPQLTNSSQELSSPDTTKKSGTRRSEKPNISYINMIAMAIKDSPSGKLTLSEIYSFLQKK